jgi:hypothetical protein
MRRLRGLSVLAFVLAGLAWTPMAGAQDAAGKKLFFEGDMVRTPRPGLAGPFCVLQSQFKRGEGVAWRIRVLGQPGQNLDDKALASVVVELSDGQKFKAKFGPHPPRGAPTDHFWSVSWVIPAEYPTGSLSYKVVATDSQGQAHTWEPFKMSFTQLTVVAGEPEPAKP